MKNLFLLLAFVCFSKVSGQMAVSDLGTYAYFADLIATSVDQYEKVKEGLKYAKEGHKMYTEVSSYVKSSKMALETADNFREIFKEASSMPKIISNIKNKNTRANFGKRFESIYKKTVVLSDVFSASFKKGGLKGNDVERLEFIYKIWEKSDEIKKEMKSLKAEIYFI